jgi:hypothetical protein
MTLRNSILAGLALCALPLAYSMIRYPNGTRGIALAVLTYFGVTVLWYGHAAIRRTNPTTSQDAYVLRHGVRWGLIVGSIWVAQIAFENVVIPRWLGIQGAVLLAIAALVSPLVAGAVSGIQSGRVRTGMRAGFWTGAISGMMAFMALSAVGYILAYFPGLPGAEIPMGTYSAEQFQALNVGDAMGGALSHLLATGAVFCSIAGAAGAAAGILLERTGRAPSLATRTPLGGSDLPNL